MSILVLGDPILDRNIYCQQSTEVNPDYHYVPQVTKIDEETTLGGALNVVHNICKLGIDVIYAGYCDIDLYQELKNIYEANIELLNLTTLLYRYDMYTITRYIDTCSYQHLFRIDPYYQTETYYEPVKITYIPPEVELVVVSDYAHGSVTNETLHALKEVWKGPIIIDSKQANEFDIRADILKLNQYERATFKDGKRLLYKDIIITFGRDGCTWNKHSKFPALNKDQVVDTCGAGDTFTAALAVARYKGFDMVDAIQFANCAAGIAVTKPGISTVTFGEVINEYNKYTVLRNQTNKEEMG